MQNDTRDDEVGGVVSSVHEFFCDKVPQTTNRPLQTHSNVAQSIGIPRYLSRELLRNPSCNVFKHDI